ncbi:MAG: lytic transglycosylase domain-containing protein [Verrucomicrobia bacterium]|nr:lytic transglycosylase domain-containing protein [Verrucomicrobiota bacterium]
MTRKARNAMLAGFFALAAATVAFLALYGMARARLFPRTYRAVVAEAAREAGIDRLLVAAVIHCESRFRPTAASPAGARGLMQIMPATASEVAAKLGIAGYNEAMLDEPGVNVRLGCGYLRELLDRFGGNETVALAAYNAGRGNVARWLEAVGGDAERMLEEQAFDETRRYVHNVLGTRRLLRRLEEIDAF